MKKPKNSYVIIEIKLSHGGRKFFKKILPESSLMSKSWKCNCSREGSSRNRWRAPLKTRHFGEGKEAARGKPECMGEYMRMWVRGWRRHHGKGLFLEVPWIFDGGTLLRVDFQLRSLTIWVGSKFVTTQVFRLKAKDWRLSLIITWSFVCSRMVAP